MKLDQVMLYVKDFEKSVDFWTRLMGFEIVEEGKLPEDFRMLALKGQDSDTTSLVLFDRAFIEKYSKEVLDNFPSLMFECEDIEKLRERLVNEGLFASPITDMGTFRTISFSDFEGNYFAVKEVV